jgi:hypothetical protein
MPRLPASEASKPLTGQALGGIPTLFRYDQYTCRQPRRDIAGEPTRFLRQALAIY